MIIIGSRALALRAPHLLDRSLKDFDFICSRDEANEFIEKYKDSIGTINEVRDTENKIVIDADTPLEFELTNPGSTAEEFANLVREDRQTTNSRMGLVPSLDALFTLKSSHRYKKNSIHFWKNAKDYHMMKAHGAIVREEWKPWLSKREKETYGYKHPKLIGSKKNSFFVPGQGVDYKYDHDSIHVAVKHLDVPAYRYFMKDGAEVECDKQKFFSLDMQTRLYSVLEESYVLALERSQIPFEGKIAPKKSFIMALSKVCTSITSGWWREFAYDNVFTVLNMYSSNYVLKFKKGLESGIVKPFDSQSPNNPYK